MFERNLKENEPADKKHSLYHRKSQGIVVYTSSIALANISHTWFKTGSANLSGDDETSLAALSVTSVSLKKNSLISYSNITFSGVARILVKGEAIVTMIILGGPGHASGNFLKFGSLKQHFLHFEVLLSKIIYSVG